MFWFWLYFWILFGCDVFGNYKMDASDAVILIALAVHHFGKQLNAIKEHNDNVERYQ